MSTASPKPFLSQSTESVAPETEREQQNDRADSSWATRPPPEELYRNLDHFFPEHDLDKALVDDNSGGIFTVADPSVKSIRDVANEHSRTLEDKRNLEPSERSTTFKWIRGDLIGIDPRGRVYIGLNTTTGAIIAVKQPQPLSEQGPIEPESVQSLKLESAVLKELDHPNIVQWLGYEETPGCLSLFLEYIPGGSIRSCLEKHGKFDEDVTKSFTAQILSGLEYLHSQKIMPPLQCDNILVQQDGVCKICDFGSAHTNRKFNLFSVAPDAVGLTRPVDFLKMNIWTLGCIMLEMWTGMRPWHGQEKVPVMLLLFRDKKSPPVPDNVILSELADDFRKKCFVMQVSRNPDERASAKELQSHKYLQLTPGWQFSEQSEVAKCRGLFWSLG
ncbi:kinase-like domain-containing protein [Mycena floridula]|nr:kinase-like domain-containing protein [Mycena floridula]